MTKYEHEFRPGDEIGGTATSYLDGKRLHYTYSQGREYLLTFDDGHVSFRMIKGPEGTVAPDPGRPPPALLPYRARQLRDGQYLVHWLVPGRVGHVSLVIDLVKKSIDVSALMPGQMEFFDAAQIHSVDPVVAAQHRR